MVKNKDFTSKLRDFTSESPELSHLLYTDSNEDIETTLNALDIEQNDIFAGITGNADLLLRSLKYNPAKVTGYDINPAQTALAEMKKKAIEILDYNDYVTLLGYNGNTQKREMILRTVSEELPNEYKQFWQQKNLVDLVRKGLWDKGGATKKDYDEWHKAISEIKGILTKDEFKTALGFNGTSDDRKKLLKKVRSKLSKYESGKYPGLNYYRFNIFRYPNGIINSEYICNTYNVLKTIVHVLKRNKYKFHSFTILK